MALGGSKYPDITKASGGNLGSSDQYDPRWQHGLRISTWLQAAAQTTDIHRSSVVTWAINIKMALSEGQA